MSHPEIGYPNPKYTGEPGLVNARGRNVRASHHLRDLGSAHPMAGGSRFVSGDEIERALEVDITSVNAPSIQGWLVFSGAVVFIVELFIVKRFVTEPGVTGLDSIASVLAAPLTWLAAIVALGWLERAIELDETGIHVRRWTERWLGRPEIPLGRPDEATARLEDPTSLVLASPGRSVRLSLSLWPHSAREDLVDELPIWGSSVRSAITGGGRTARVDAGTSRSKPSGHGRVLDDR